MSKFPGELTPFKFKDTGIEVMIRKVSPLPAPARLGGTKYLDIWLVDKSGRFRPSQLAHKVAQGALQRAQFVRAPRRTGVLDRQGGLRAAPDDVLGEPGHPGLGEGAAGHDRRSRRPLMTSYVGASSLGTTRHDRTAVQRANRSRAASSAASRVR